MDTGWRLTQVDYNRMVRGALAEAGRGIGVRFWGWEAVLMFYEFVIVLDGYAELRGMPAPQSHAARRSIVDRHLPHLAEIYEGSCGLSVTARYHNGYAMTTDAGLEAARCYEALARSIPAQL